MQKHEEPYEEDEDDGKHRHSAQSPRNSTSMGARDVRAGIFLDKTQQATMVTQKKLKRAAKRRARRRRKRETKDEGTADDIVMVPDENDDYRHPAQSPRQEAEMWNSCKDEVTDRLGQALPEEPETPDVKQRQLRGRSPSAADIFKSPVPDLKLKQARDAIRSIKAGIDTEPLRDPMTPAKKEQLLVEGREHMKKHQPPSLSLFKTPEPAGIRNSAQSPDAGGLTPQTSKIFKFKDTLRRKPTLKAAADHEEQEEEGFKVVARGGGKRGNRMLKLKHQDQAVSGGGGSVFPGSPGGGDSGDSGNSLFPGSPGGQDWSTPSQDQNMTPRSKAARRRQRKKLATTVEN